METEKAWKQILCFWSPIVRYLGEMRWLLRSLGSNPEPKAPHHHPPLALLDSFELDGEHLWAATIQILIADQPGRGGETSSLLWQTSPHPLLLLAGYLQQVGWSRPNRQLWDKEFTAPLAQTLGSAAVKAHFPISSVVPLSIIGAPQYDKSKSCKLCHPQKQ